MATQFGYQATGTVDRPQKGESAVLGNLATIVEHSGDDECAACRAQDIAASILVPAVMAWEVSEALPRFSLAIHGSAGLLGILLESGIDRKAIDAALSSALDDLEQQIAENRTMGGPPQGTA